MRLAALVLLAANGLVAQLPGPQTATFKAGTRLVEVEVVVRNKNGPVTSLTKDDFTILDEGKPQRIEVFRPGQSRSNAQTIPLPASAVTNRPASGSTASAGYTAVLFDRLNTTVEFREYERKALVSFIRRMDPAEHAAIYVLGSNLHVLQEFTDDPAKLIAALQREDSGRDLMPANSRDALEQMGGVITGARMPGLLSAEMAHSIRETAANVAQVNAAHNGITTEQALAIITHQLGEMPGRRNLVWMTEDWMTAMPFVGVLQQSHIALYSVMARSLDYNPFGIGFAEVDMTPGHTLLPPVIYFQRDNRQLAAQTGGAGFDDATDVGLAVRRAEEDSRSAYTLGYYPPEELLDGTYHRLTVKVEGKGNAHLEIVYRPGYLATSQEAGFPTPENSMAELFRNPLDNSNVGISAQWEPDARTRLFKVRLTLDLHDVHLVREGGHSKGSIELGFLNGKTAKVRTIPIDLTDEQLAPALRDGYWLLASGVPATGDAIRLAVCDPSTGVAGSLTIPVKR